jgi:hypothetical protein
MAQKPPMNGANRRLPAQKEEFSNTPRGHKRTSTRLVYPPYVPPARPAPEL